ncbi:MAG: transposase [Desulfobacterales bacterium]
MAILSVYHPRDPKASSLWQIFNRHYDDFEKSYSEKFEKKYGFFRPVIGEVIRSYLRCGDLKEGFARIRCPNCGNEKILSFSCKSRCICPSCQAKRAIILGHHLNENVLYPVPHRQYVFSIPIMLRIYFKYDRSLLTGLCQCAYRSLLTFLREVVGLKDGIPGVVMCIHTFGFSPERWHPHLHALVTDGLFKDTGIFYVMKDMDLKPLELLFRAEVFSFLKKEGKITDELIGKLMKWKFSGFSIDNGERIKKEDKKGRETIAQYMMRNVFNVKNITYIEKTGKVIYHTGKMQKGKNKKNFTVFSAEEFIAAIVQHIPKKNFQMIRYFGWYSNKSRGIRKIVESLTADIVTKMAPDEVEVIDVSKYQPKNVPTLTWRECIKKIWKQDPLVCPECLNEMKIIAFIDNPKIIKKILKYLDLWEEELSRGPPLQTEVPDETVYVPIEDAGWEQYEIPDFSG